MIDTQDSYDRTQTKVEYILLGFAFSAFILIAFGVGFTIGSDKNDNADNYVPHHESNTRDSEGVIGGGYMDKKIHEWKEIINGEDGDRYLGENNESWFHGEKERGYFNFFYSDKGLRHKLDGLDADSKKCFERAYFALSSAKNPQDIIYLFGDDPKAILDKIRKGYNLEGIAYENGRPRDFVVGELKDRFLEEIERLEDVSLTQREISNMREFLEKEIITCPTAGKD